MTVTAVTSITVLGPAGALADTGSAPASFCQTARRLADSFERIDETDPDESVDDLREAERAYRRLSDRAPARLQRSFRKILAFFPTLKDASTGALDIDDRKEGQRFVTAATTAAPAFDRVFAYLGDRCDLDFD